MSLETVIKSAVAAVKTATNSLQAQITHEPFLGDSPDGKRIYDTSTTYNVIIEHRTRYVTARDRDGLSQLSKTQIQFLEQVTLTEQDRITLPDGSKPQILSIEGVVDSDGLPYAARVYF